MKYPKEYLNEIKLRLKVSQVVGKTVQLKKRGKEFIGLSPFKNEKIESFFLLKLFINFPLISWTGSGQLISAFLQLSIRFKKKVWR